MQNEPSISGCTLSAHRPASANRTNTQKELFFVPPLIFNLDLDESASVFSSQHNHLVSGDAQTRAIEGDHANPRPC